MIAAMRAAKETGKRMALLTNNVREWEPLWRTMLPVDEIFELVVDSAFVGMRKPEPEIYRLTLGRLRAHDASSATSVRRLRVRRRRRGELHRRPRARHQRRALPRQRPGDPRAARGAGLTARIAAWPSRRATRRQVGTPTPRADRTPGTGMVSGGPTATRWPRATGSRTRRIRPPPADAADGRHRRAHPDLADRTQQHLGRRPVHRGGGRAARRRPAGQRRDNRCRGPRGPGFDRDRGRVCGARDLHVHPVVPSRLLEPAEARGRHLRYGTGWAIGAWFIPIFNLFRPKQIANDIDRASAPDAGHDQRLASARTRCPAALVVGPLHPERLPGELRRPRDHQRGGRRVAHHRQAALDALEDERAATPSTRSPPSSQSSRRSSRSW